MVLLLQIHASGNQTENHTHEYHSTANAANIGSKVQRSPIVPAKRRLKWKQWHIPRAVNMKNRAKLKKTL